MNLFFVGVDVATLYCLPDRKQIMKLSPIFKKSQLRMYLQPLYPN